MPSSDDWKRLQELFHQACALPEAERAAFAKAQVGDAPELMGELMAMLAAEAGATEAVQAPLRGLVRQISAPAPELPAGTRLGPWQVDRLIGKGGMGQVYLGHRADGTYDRQVAIKVIGSHDRSPQRREYFTFERRMLAHMQHPSIAQIHDAGSDGDGRLYLVMEYVEGTSLTRWCQQHKLDLRERVKLLLRVVEGVQHAHQKGVIHRDLKPGNLLVGEIDGQAAPRIIDFGIAADTASGSDSSPEAAGTPGYMSPEQSTPGMDIDSRSDVYSLGAILFELVSGQRPHGAPTTGANASGHSPLRPSERIDTLTPEEFASLAENLRTAPQRLRRAMRDDLDWIVARATQPDRNLRYPSAASFGEDLQRWLDGFPAQAAPNLRLYRARKFIRRHRGGVLAALVVCLAILAGLVGTTLGWQRAEQATRREQAANRFLSDILTSVDPSMSFDLDQTLMRRVLEKASERVETMLADQPEARASVETTLAYTYRNLGDLARARTHLESALESATQALGRDSLPAQTAIMELASLLTEQGELARAETMMRDNLDAAYRLSALDPVLGPRMESRLGWNLHQQGRHADALPLLEHSYEALRERLGEEHQRTVDAAQNYAIGLSQNDRMDEAIALMAKITDLQARLRGSDHPQTLALRNSLASFHSAKGDFAAAETQLRAMLEALAGQHGSGPRMRPVVEFNLALTLSKSGDPAKVEEAGPLFRSAIEAMVQQSGPDTPQAVTMRRLYAGWLADSGKSAEAREEHAALLASARKVFGEGSPALASLLSDLARQDRTMGDRSQARKYAESALALLQQQDAPDEDALKDIEALLETIDTGTQAPH